jgi:hypothetical protein
MIMIHFEFSVLPFKSRISSIIRVLALAVGVESLRLGLRLGGGLQTDGQTPTGGRRRRWEPARDGTVTVAQ